MSDTLFARYTEEVSGNPDCAMFGAPHHPHVAEAAQTLQGPTIECTFSKIFKNFRRYNSAVLPR